MSIFDDHILSTPKGNPLIEWWKDYIYYPLYRFFRYSEWANPKRMYREIRWFIQRGRRGWANCDTWSMDNYLADILPPMLRYLKEHKHGVPMSMFPHPEGFDPSEEDHAVAEMNWNATMDKMIAGFEAWNRLTHGLYEKELGAYPLDKPVGVSYSAWEQSKHSRFEASEVLRERDTKIWEEGAALFIQHFGSLWD